MIYLGKNIPEFIMDSRTLIFGIKDDSFIKERILPYKVDEERIDEMVTIYYEAEKAESEKTKEFGEQLEARNESPRYCRAHKIATTHCSDTVPRGAGIRAREQS